MYILTIHGKETEGAYSVKNEYGEQILYIFEQEDDAVDSEREEPGESKPEPAGPNQ